MEKLKGYSGILRERGKFVPADVACAYAMNKCGVTIIDPEAPMVEEFKEEIVTWFFSGNWVEVYEEGDDA